MAVSLESIWICTWSLHNIYLLILQRLTVNVLSQRDYLKIQSCRILRLVWTQISSETSVTLYRSTWPNIPEDFNLHQYLCENIRPRQRILLHHCFSTFFIVSSVFLSILLLIILRHWSLTVCPSLSHVLCTRAYRFSNMYSCSTTL